MSKKLEDLKKQLELLDAAIDSGKYAPTSKSGKQKSPNEIRSEIRKYLTSSGSNYSN